MLIGLYDNATTEIELTSASSSVYYKYMEYIIDKTSNEYVYFNEDGTVKETNYKRKYDYFIAGMSCYDDEYPTHR